MVFVFFICGILLGILSGLLPGIHSNTVISILSSFNLSNYDFTFLILGLLPVSIIVSFLPSIFFGIPEENTVVSVLPGQRMVLEGRGLAALKVVVLSILVSVLFASALFVFSLELFTILYSIIQPYMKFIVLALSLIFLLRTKRPHYSLLVFLFAGVIGLFSFKSEIKDVFLPMFSGMFALASIMTYGRQLIPEQKDEVVDMNFTWYALLGTIAGALADLLPGVSSPSQIATFLTLLIPLNSLNYLATASSVSISQALFSFATASSLGKARIGATAKLMEIADISNSLPLLLIGFLVSSCIAVILVYVLRKRIGKLANIDFFHFNILLALYLLAVVFIIDGFLGVFIMIISAALGFMTIKLGIERTNLMGAVILPTLLLLFRIFI